MRLRAEDLGLALRGQTVRTDNSREQDLPAAGATAPLGRVLGLGRQESLTPAARDVHLAGATRRPSAHFLTHKARLSKEDCFYCAMRQKTSR